MNGSKSPRLAVPSGLGKLAANGGNSTQSRVGGQPALQPVEKENADNSAYGSQ